MAGPNALLDRAADPSPSLLVKYDPESNEKPRTIEVEHSLGACPTDAGRGYLNSLADCSALDELLDFYEKYNGIQFCRTFDARYGEVRPLLELKAAESIAGFTGQYSPGGDRAWIMDHNKSQSLYRGSARWLAFAEIGSGPMCLTIFLDGDQAGSVFFATPQPWFNILRPVAKGFNALLVRIAGDPAAFLRLVRATVNLRGDDGFAYGFVPIVYQSGDVQPTKQAGRNKR
jgi:hypothetical protein